MPRETIRSVDEEFLLKVGWDHLGSVQVGIAAPGTLKLGDQHFDSLWSTLDRQGCNDLIRLLRRARDAAFGRDE